MTDFVEHNLIKEGKLERREYQDYLVDKGKNESTLVVLPTGTGKTIVTLRITAERLLDNYGGTSLMMAPTKPLVEQHYNTYSELLDIDDDEIVMFTGDTRPQKREEIWDNSTSVVIATPSVIENDVISERISLEDVIHLTVDECHRATGNYPYVYVCDKYVEQAKEPLITGLSASPGDTKEDILNICENINVSSIEIITENDPMIEEYIYDTDIETRFIDISEEILEIRDTLQDVYKDRLVTLYEDDYVDSRSKTLSQVRLNKARGKIQQAMAKGESSAYQAMSVWAEAMKLNTAIEIVETQGINAFLEYYERLEEELRGKDSSKAVERLIADPEIQSVVKKAKEFDGRHEKVDVLRSELVRAVKIEGGKSLVFTKSRDTVEYLTDVLSGDFSVGRLVGQTDKNNSDGMTQKEQKEAVQKFASGDFEVLISTQIGEEGLDISEVDSVLFYEPASRGIEQIQRQGRTGRSQQGRVVILIGNDTRDVGMYFKSKNNVEQMQADVEELQEIEDLEEEIQDELTEQKEQMTLEESFKSEEKLDESPDEVEATAEKNDVSFEEEKVKFEIFADSRETNSSVVRELDTDDEVNVTIENNLEVGDYVVGDECVVERKDVVDFHDTLTGDRSIFEQVKNMAQNYDRPVLLIEGGHGELYTKNIHPNAVRGVLASIVSDFDATIVESVDEEDTAKILKQLAKREQEDSETVVNPHGNKETSDVTSQQEYIVSSIEGIGPKTSEKLLSHFGSIKSVFDAEVDELKQVDGIGKESAEKIYSIIRTEYAG
jgi:Fanconi anemia group M protein